jgi:hypothetical protein
MDLTDSQEGPGKMEMKKMEMTKKTSQIGLTNFMHSCIKLMSLTFTPRQPPIPFLFLSCISTLTQATDFSEEDTSAIGTTNTNIDDYILAPQSVQAKVNNFHLLKVFQWLQDLGQPDGLSDTEYATFMQYCTDFFIDDNRIWHKDSHGAHKLVISPGRQLDVCKGTSICFLTSPILSHSPPVPPPHLCTISKDHT